MANGANGRVMIERRVLIAKLAAIGNRLLHYNRRHDEGEMTVGRIAQFITECGKEFDLSNDEQMLFLKFIAAGHASADELLTKGDGNGNQ